jgi:hypothetical protein
MPIRHFAADPPAAHLGVIHQSNMSSARFLCGFAALLISTASAETICFFTDAQCKIPSQTMPCQMATPNTGLWCVTRAEDPQASADHTQADKPA